MTISASLLPEFDLELANARRTLDRIPAEKLDWGPHKRSMTFRSLATHIFTMPRTQVMRSMVLNHRIHHSGAKRPCAFSFESAAASTVVRSPSADTGSRTRAVGPSTTSHSATS